MRAMTVQPDPGGAAGLTPSEFRIIQQWLRHETGICMGEAKQALICGRLSRRLRELGLGSFEAYFRQIQEVGNGVERQVAINLLTTNETYFFREPDHFELLRQHILTQRPTHPFRIWSAACASGEEVYSLAMTLATLPLGRWEILGSDISTRVLETAARGVYSLSEAERIDPEILGRYCLKGVGRQEGFFAIGPQLRKHVQLRQINLVNPLPEIGPFDVIFLRNALIYFDNDIRRKVVEGMLPALRPGGLLVIGHAESLHGITNELKLVKPSVYRRG